MLGQVEKKLKGFQHRMSFVVEEYRARRLSADYLFGTTDRQYKRIYHYHIKKTGGTSLNYMFCSLAYPSLSGDMQSSMAQSLYEMTCQKNRSIIGSKVFVSWNKKMIAEGKYFYAWSHFPAYQLHPPADTFTITCVRDPVKRVLSRYNELMYYREHNIQHPGMIPAEKWLGNNLSDFLDKVPRQELLSQLFMFSQDFSLEEAFERICNCSYFFPTEQFSRGVAEMSTLLGVDLQPIHVRKAQKKYPVTEAEFNRLQELLEPELILYDRLAAHYQKRGILKNIA
jgi:hypothetical protein